MRGDKKEKGNILDYVKTPHYKLLNKNTNENLFEVSDLTNNANPSSNSLDTYFTERGSEHNTIINIDLYDDQISVSSIQSSPSLSLDGINTNLMQFPSGGENVDENSGIFDNINCSGEYFENSSRWTK